LSTYSNPNPTSLLVNTKTSLSGTNNHASINITYIIFIPHSDAHFELQEEIVLTMSTCLNACLNALSCHVNGGLDI